MDKSRAQIILESSLLAECKVLAKTYRLSFNMLVNLLLEDAVTEWRVPGMEPRSRPGEAEDEQKALT